MKSVAYHTHTCACFASTTLPNESYFVNPPRLQCHLVSLRTLWRQTLRSKPPKAAAAATCIMIFTFRPAYQTRTSSDYHHSSCIRSHNVPSKLYLLSDIQFEIQYCSQILTNHCELLYYTSFEKLFVPHERDRNRNDMLNGMLPFDSDHKLYIIVAHVAMKNTIGKKWHNFVRIVTSWRSVC